MKNTSIALESGRNIAYLHDKKNTSIALESGRNIAINPRTTMIAPDSGGEGGQALPPLIIKHYF